MLRLNYFFKAMKVAFLVFFLAGCTLPSTLSVSLLSSTSLQSFIGAFNQGNAGFHVNELNKDVMVGNSASIPRSGYEPPINIFLVLHIDPIQELGAETFKAEPEMYQRTHDEIDWLMEEAEEHQLHFTSLYNGWYPKWALDHNDTDQFKELINAGHEIGSHAHQITYDEESDTWITHNDKLSIFGRPNYDPALARECWQDASSYINSVLDKIKTTGQNKIMCSTALSFSDEKKLMAEFKFTIAAGNRLEAGANYFGHMPWNTWRAANNDEPGYEIAEDLKSPYVSINHAAQIGMTESHAMYVTVPQLQRQFLMLYAEWLKQERTSADDRIWSFGFVYHPNHGDKYNEDLIEFLDWLEKYFINKKSQNGNTIAKYATISEISREFLAWEKSHRGVSSFNYKKGDPYPYSFSALAEQLPGADYEETVDLGKDISCFKFVKEKESIFLVWSNKGNQEVDFSKVLSGEVIVIDASTGKEIQQDAGKLKLSEEPNLIKKK